MNLFSKLVNGGFGLPRTYWLFGVVGGLVVGWVAGFAFGMILGETAPFLAVLLAFAVSTAYSVIVYVGIWRACASYAGNKIWATLARICVILGCVGLAWQAYNLIALYQLLSALSGLE